ncbi:MAG: DUF444 family protein [Ectothiorhodospiraceae bacterium]|nr:DUF444 family protein [Ectothiorhodospiraceae bacterium]
MAGDERTDISSTASQHRWYELFSRGARDWLRHNQKVRDAVREQLPELVAGSDILSRPGDRTVQVPVRFLEHYRFRLRDQHQQGGVGQGPGEPGDVFRRGQPGGGEGQGGAGGSGEGELRFVLELKVDDIVDWLWEELKLPDLKPRTTDAVTDEDLVREGWDRRGPRARLDRRRTLREAVKRRTARPEQPAFTDDDLRYRQLARRRHPAVNAVVAFVLDVSASMDPGRRKLAKAFFFWATQGLRRRYGNLETVFIAHTNEAWEFDEESFFQVAATGGTVASSAFRLVREIFSERYPPAHYNQYVFYASDGDNFADDRQAAEALLLELAGQVNFMGLVETPQNRFESSRSETGRLFKALEARNHPVGSFTVHSEADIWEAIRAFFQRQAAA